MTQAEETRLLDLLSQQDHRSLDVRETTMLIRLSAKKARELQASSPRQDIGFARPAATALALQHK